MLARGMAKSMRSIAAQENNCGAIEREIASILHLSFSTALPILALRTTLCTRFISQAAVDLRLLMNRLPRTCYAARLSLVAQVVLAQVVAHCAGITPVLLAPVLPA